MFEIEIRSSPIVNTAASGAAIRALNAYNKLCGTTETTSFKASSWSDKLVVKPKAESFPIYRNMLLRFEKLEKMAVNDLNNNS